MFIKAYSLNSSLREGRTSVHLIAIQLLFRKGRHQNPVRHKKNVTVRFTEMRLQWVFFWLEWSFVRNLSLTASFVFHPHQLCGASPFSSLVQPSVFLKQAGQRFLPPHLPQLPFPSQWKTKLLRTTKNNEMPLVKPHKYCQWSAKLLSDVLSRFHFNYHYFLFVSYFV